MISCEMRVWQEIKEVSEKQRQSDVGLRALSAAAPFSARLRPHLTYDYSEPEVKSIPLMPGTCPTHA